MFCVKKVQHITFIYKKVGKHNYFIYKVTNNCYPPPPPSKLPFCCFMQVTLGSWYE